MPKQLLQIDWFWWIQNNETTQNGKGFVDMVWLDITSEEWICQINKRLEDVSFTTAMTTDPLSNTTFWWEVIFWNSDEEIWYESASWVFSKLHTNTNAWDNNDIITYQNYLIYCSIDEIWRSTTTTIWWGFTDNPTWWSGTNAFTNWTLSWKHWMKVFNNRLYITDWNIVAELDWASDPANPSNWVFSDEVFRLPDWEIIDAIEDIWGQLAFWTNNWNMYIWDWVSANSDTIIKTQLWGIHSIIQLENRIIVFAGVQWTIYQYNGADLIPIIQIPNFNILQWSHARKPSVRRYKNWLIFWISFNGIYVYDRVDSSDNFTLTKYWNLSEWQVIDANEWQIFSIYNTGTSSSSWNFIVWYDHNWPDIDQVSPTGKRYRAWEAWTDDMSAAPFFETFVYHLRDDKWKVNKVQWVQWLFKWVNVNSIQIEYRFDTDDSYTILWQIWDSWVDIDMILRGIWKRVDKIQFRVKFWDKTTLDTLERNTKLINLKVF